MPFVNTGPRGGRGLLGTAATDRPNPPNQPPYSTPPAVRVADLRTLNKYAAAPPGTTLELALHHVVPWAVLRDFWNALAGAGWYDPLRDFAALFGRAKALTSHWPDDMANDRFTDRVPGPLGDLPTALCWWPWNLVRGPKHRTTAALDRGVAGVDPGDDIDDLSRGNGKHAVHVTAMCGVGRHMSQVVAATQRVETGPWVIHHDRAGVTEAIRRWQVLARHPLVEFDPAVWRIESNSPDYAPSVNHGPVRHPRWSRVTRNG